VLRRARVVVVTLSAGVLMTMSGCTGSGFTPTPPPLSAEAFCATLPTIGTGHAFYCGTNQGNLAKQVFPDGAHGFCYFAGSNNLGLVGYSAVTINGGAFPVDTFSNAQALCSSVNAPGLTQCISIITCTRQ
jgi:hypothetical protein